MLKGDKAALWILNDTSLVANWFRFLKDQTTAIVDRARIVAYGGLSTGDDGPDELFKDVSAAAQKVEFNWRLALEAKKLRERIQERDSAPMERATLIEIDRALEHLATLHQEVQDLLIWVCKVAGTQPPPPGRTPGL